MKRKLLNKTLRVFALYSLVVLATSIPVYYKLVDTIWLGELDENNEIIAERIENELNRLQLSDTELVESIALWNKIQPNTNLKELPAIQTKRPDSTYTVLRASSYTDDTDIDRFRGLSRSIVINGKWYELTVETNVEETEETVGAIALVTLLFFLILVIGFLLLNKRLSDQLWQPFRDTLSKLKAFNLNRQKPIEFQTTDTHEFEELNTSLHKLLTHSISAYKTQKEFTENASHELQTPLAVIKNKLDNLLQKEPVTDRQYQIIEEINQALTRVTRINKNLLLLAKIENRQFDDNETIDFSLLVQQCIERLEEHAQHKNISIHRQIAPDILIDGNKTLIEILLNNLLINAIRHNVQNGTIAISLNPGKLNISNTGTTELDTEKLFKRFTVLSSETVNSGLGLAIVKEICNHAGWHVNYAFVDGFHSFSVRF